MIAITSPLVVSFALYLRPLSASLSVSCGQAPFIQNVHVKTPVHVHLLGIRLVDEEEALGHHERGPPRRRPGQREAGGELGPTPSRHERARPPEREPARGYARPTTTCRSLDLMRELLDDLMREPSGNPSTSVFPRSSAGPEADVLMPARLGESSRARRSCSRVRATPQGSGTRRRRGDLRGRDAVACLARRGRDRDGSSHRRWPDYGRGDTWRSCRRLPDAGAQHKSRMVERAAEYGIDPAEIEATPKPMLMRVIVDPEVDITDANTLRELNTS